MIALDVANLLNDVGDLAAEVGRAPFHDVTAWRRRAEQLGVRLEDMIKSNGCGMARFLDNAAPVVLLAIDRALIARAFNDNRGVGEWSASLGFLLPMVRADARAAIDSVTDSREDKR